MDWTDERIAALRKLWLEGQSASQVARQLGGVSRNAVIGKVHRLGLAGREAPSRPRSLGGRPPGSTKSRPVETSTPKVALPRAAAVQRPSQIGAAQLSDALAEQVSAVVSKPVAPPAPRFDARPSATILTLGEHACRWPIGDPDEAGFGFCGARRAGSSSYCEAHAGASLRRKTRPVDADALASWVGAGSPRPARVIRRAAY
jgi:GcrA cell cycle regulator